MIRVQHRPDETGCFAEGSGRDGVNRLKAIKDISSRSCAVLYTYPISQVIYLIVSVTNAIDAIDKLELT